MHVQAAGQNIITVALRTKQKPAGGVPGVFFGKFVQHSSELHFTGAQVLLVLLLFFWYSLRAAIRLRMLVWRLLIW